MASITYDSQSFMLDGRRIWIVSGSIHYARVPREEWADRIHAARAAGLNTIETPIFWGRHEPRPGQFDFTGDADIRHFVELVGRAGMWCILRPGPYIGSSWDLGGVPAWVLALPGVALRRANPPFLEACSRYISALGEQLRDLQMTSARGGPILLVQNESAWTCGHDDLAAAYLGELARYLREAGFDVPVINSNDLWQSVEGEIDCWTGSNSMLPHLRQLAEVAPNQPRLVVEYRVSQQAAWGHPAPAPMTPADVARGLAEILAAGGQFNIDPFCGGSNFGYWGGRLDADSDAFATASRAMGAPLGESGDPGPMYHAVRPIATFASRFARVLSHLDPARQTACLLPAPPAAPAPAGSRQAHAAPGTTAAHRPVSLVHATGSQGSVVFLFNASAGTAPVEHTLVLPDGSTLALTPGDAPVRWYLLDARLAGRAQLDWANVSPVTLVGRVLVCTGVPGTRARLSINGARLEADIPRADEPLLLEHEGIAVVLAADEHLARIHASEDAVYIGVSGLARDGQPIFPPDAKSCLRIDADGTRSTIKAGGERGRRAPRTEPARPTGRVTIKGWESAPLDAYVDGTSARYASIPGPADLSALGAPYGYGWYKLAFPSGTGRRVQVAFPGAGDRLHLFLDGESVGLVGAGPGAERTVQLPLKKRAQTLVALAENLGRFSSGEHLTERKGFYAHAWEVEPIRLPKPSLETGAPIDVLEFRAPLSRVHRGDGTQPARPTWSLAHKRRTPVLLTLHSPPARGLVLLNGTPLQWFDRAGPASILLEPDQLSRGTNTIQLAVLAGDPEALLAPLAGALALHECLENFSARASWSFAKWQVATPDAFSPRERRAAGDVPTWWRASFTPPEGTGALRLELAGLSKGQLYVNGRHLGRYFVATASGTPVGPQADAVIPGAWIHAGAPNELLILDEHGRTPAKCRLEHAHAPTGT